MIRTTKKINDKWSVWFKRLALDHLNFWCEIYLGEDGKPIEDIEMIEEYRDRTERKGA